MSYSNKIIKNDKQFAELIEFVIGSGNSKIKQKDFDYITKKYNKYIDNIIVVDGTQSIDSSTIEKNKKKINTLLYKYDKLFNEKKKQINKLLEDLDDDFIFLNKLNNAIQSMVPQEGFKASNNLSIIFGKAPARKSSGKAPARKSSGKKIDTKILDTFYNTYNKKIIKKNHIELFKLLKNYYDDIPDVFIELSFHSYKFKTEILPKNKQILQKMIDENQKAIDLIKNFNKGNKQGGNRKTKKNRE